MPLRHVPTFLARLRDLYNLLATSHGNYCGTFQAALMEAQGLALVGPHGRVFNHRASMQGFANGLNNNLERVDHIIEVVRTHNAVAGSLLTSGVGPFLGLCRRRFDLAQRTDNLIQAIAAVPAEAGRLGGAPVAPRGRRAGDTLAQYLQSLLATGWAPSMGGNGILAAFRMADPATQELLEEIEQVPPDGAGAAHETAEAAAASRQLIAQFASRYRATSDVFSGYAAAIERHWTPHGMLNA